MQSCQSQHIRARVNSNVRAYTSAFTCRRARAPLCGVRLPELRLRRQGRMERGMRWVGMRARGRDTLGSPIVKLPQSHRTVAQIALDYTTPTQEKMHQKICTKSSILHVVTGRTLTVSIVRFL